MAAVVFDLDGVLIDSEPVWEQVRRTYVAECGGRWPADAQDRLMGMSTPEWARYLSEEAGVGQQPAAVATAAAGLTHRFAVTVSAEEVPRGKPAPDVYLAAARGLGLPPEHCVAVEDSTNGLLAAAAAGLAVIALPRPDYRPSAEALRGARIVATHLGELTPSTIEGLDV